MSALSVDTTPDVLEWARQSIGLSIEVAAKKIGVDTIVLRYWEAGAETDDIKGPTIGQLRKMAEAYKRPLAALLLPEPPPAADLVGADFRLLPRNQDRAWSPELRVALRRVRMQRGVAGDLADLAGELPEPLALTIDLDQAPEALGETIRAWLGTPQWVAKDSDLRQWIEQIESKGILITQVQRVSLEEMRGCSIGEQPFPVIVLNGADSQKGKTFTLMHELAHILLHTGGLCDLEDRTRHISSAKERIERFCNQVAAAILMPREELLGHLRSYPAGIVKSDDVLRQLAEGYGVSREALLLRLVTLGWASWDDYFRAKPHFEEIYEARGKSGQEDKGGGPTYYTMKVRDLGRRYISTVLEAYHREDINNAELARYLHIKVNHIAALEATLGEQRRVSGSSIRSIPAPSWRHGIDVTRPMFSPACGRRSRS